MRAHYLILLNAASLACFAQRAEEEAIKKLVEQETISFAHKDYNTWANTWAHDSAAYVIWTGTTTHRKLMGWNAISASYKEMMNNIPVYDEAMITPVVKKDKYQIVINGNTATVTFEEGTGSTTFGARTLVKQNGGWKILNLTLVNERSYRIMETVALLRNVIGTWELGPGGPKTTLSDGGEFKNVRYEIAEAPNGFTIISTGSLVSANGNVAPMPLETEFFIPDYNLMEVVCLDIQKSQYGETYTSPGKLKLNKDGSFTVRYMYAEKPTATKYEYTVNFEGVRWHQVTKWFAIDGRQTESFDHYMQKPTRETNTF